MAKLFLGSSIVSLSFLSLGTNVTPNSPVFWLASASLSYQVVRITLVAMLAAQFLTRPPRHIVFRLLTSLVAFAAAAWTFQQTYHYQMPALDTLAFLTASLAILITSMERRFTLTRITTHKRQALTPMTA